MVYYTTNPHINLDAVIRNILKETKKSKSTKEAINLNNKRLFFMYLQMYISKQAQELYIRPKTDSIYSVEYLAKDGSKKRDIPISSFFVEEILKGLNKWIVWSYNPYSDREQWRVVDVEYKRQTYNVEVCVKQSRYGREIVLRPPTDMKKYATKTIVESTKMLAETLGMVTRRMVELSKTGNK